MHELAICQALISQVEDVVRERSARVKRVLVGIGPLSGVEPRLLEDAYPLASAGTCADGSQLATEQISVRVRCRTCKFESDAEPNRLLCGACGDWRTDLLSGDELMLLRVELETQEDAMELANV
jgi:hydrogenase nickel incorporation protein HypA/HybF